MTVAQADCSAILLAAGNGDRFRNTTRQSKLLEPLLGRPILQRTLESAYEAGVRDATVVLGYQAERVRAIAAAHAPRALRLDFVYNPDWHLENGVSVLAAEPRVRSDRFAVLMGDHVFDPDVLRRLFAARVERNESVLAVDARPTRPGLAAEATKVRRHGSYIIAIGKTFEDYDALDTGVFVCARPLFAALAGARAAGDTTLSGGIRRLAKRGLMRAMEIGDATWCDIDTMSDLAAAETALLAAPIADPVA